MINPMYEMSLFLVTTLIVSVLVIVWVWKR
jgi:hypothetical protein